ncbi:1-acyl-sn-glycerol-3-phosphate acyltransferase [Dokdonella fugitiva]|uniref:1-acyl-sn-glycerol-3-phosphate acyltransferase n=1 Tax=Dokdonella fugitiva TaxID=328517 RepID=A0A839FBY7_9GAMM|nr:MFS transporter [Dokdonella fugitiva]MBA8889594.1 1-acyl-sn-glycerol-3-phosphate acyltransferase [Dokdonella fugitiva]
MSGSSQFRLLGTRRFAPFFATQALGAFNDNAFRNALVVLVGYHMGLDEHAVGFYSNIAPALFILPFFLFSASAGQLAEKYEKARIIRWVKLFEIAAMTLAAAGFWFKSIPLLLSVLFLMGLHSTVFGPIKYAILPQTLRADELVGGNGLVEMGTSLAVLVGMIAGGVAMSSGPLPASLLVIAIALVGWLTSRAIPPAPATAPDLRFNWNPFTETWRVLGFVTKNRTVFNSVLGISWFWFFGGVFTMQLPNYTKIFLGGTESVQIFVLALFSIGVGIGSLLCERLSGHKVEIGLVPFGSIGLTVFGLDLYFARPAATALHDLSAFAFLAAPGGWRIALDFVLVGLFAGFYIVPLFALVQSRAERSELSRVIAGNNIVNALFIVGAAAFGLGLSAAGLSIPQILLATAVLNALVAIYIYTLVPEFLMRFLSWILVNTLYRIKVEGTERIPDEGAALLVCNHVSFMDALIIGGSVRRPVRFVMYYKIFEIPVLKFIFRTAKAIPIAGRKENPQLLERAFDEVDRALADGELVCIFPEGGLTRDGTIDTFRPGVEQILARRAVPVVPLALRGLWGSVFSRRDSALGRARLPRRFRARIGLVAGTPLPAAEASAPVLEQRVRELRGADA